MRLVRFKSFRTGINYWEKMYQGQITIELDNQLYYVTIPVFGSSSVITNIRSQAWRHVEGNLDRLREACLNGTSRVIGNKAPK